MHEKTTLTPLVRDISKQTVFSPEFVLFGLIDVVFNEGYIRALRYAFGGILIDYEIHSPFM